MAVEADDGLYAEGFVDGGQRTAVNEAVLVVELVVVVAACCC